MSKITFIKKIRKLMAIGGAFALLLVGCGNPGTGNSGEGEKEQVSGRNKQQIIIGYNENLVPQLLSEAIVSFNKSNAEYEVVIKGYDWQDGQRLLETELATGKGPDLFDLSMVYVENMAEKGLIADLAPFLEDDQGLKREQLVESVLDCNTVEGILTCVPARFTLNLLLGKSSLIGEEASWSVEEFLQCVRDYEGMQIANGNYYFRHSELSNKYSIVEVVLQNGVEHYIEDGKANFNQPKFRTLLELANEYQADNFPYDAQDDFLEQVQTEELLLVQSGITRVEDYTEVKGLLGEDMQYIGYPTYEGSSFYGIRNYIALGMNPNSQVKEEAWAFLEFLATYQLTNKGGDYGFWTVEELLEEQFAEAMVKEYKWGDNGEAVKDEQGNPVEEPKRVSYNNKGEVIGASYAATEEDIAIIRSLIDEASYAYDLSGNSVFQIVESEVLGYLYGDKTLDETIEIIQSRVQIYLDEQN